MSVLVCQESEDEPENLPSSTPVCLSETQLLQNLLGSSVLLPHTLTWSEFLGLRAVELRLDRAEYLMSKNDSELRMSFDALSISEIWKAERYGSSC